MNDVERLVAIEDIRRLKARFFRVLDEQDWVGYGQVLAPDALLDMSSAQSDAIAAEGSLMGRDAIVSFARGVLEGAVTVHHGHMEEIEVMSPTSARAIWTMEDRLWFPEGHEPRELHGFGHYHDDYVKADGRWWIERTAITRQRVLIDGV